MKRTRFGLIMLTVVLLLALPTAALASKRIFTADLKTEAGVQKGSALLGTNPDGSIRVSIVARSLSSPVTAAHVHSAVDGSVLITICDSASPTPGVPLCDPAPGGGNSVQVAANVSPAMMHVSAVVLSGLLNSDMTYVNVHTSLNPGGEVSGTLTAP